MHENTHARTSFCALFNVMRIPINHNEMNSISEADWGNTWREKLCRYIETILKSRLMCRPFNRHSREWGNSVALNYLCSALVSWVCQSLNGRVRLRAEVWAEIGDKYHISDSISNNMKFNIPYKSGTYFFVALIAARDYCFHFLLPPSVSFCLHFPVNILNVI